jgi:CHAT domain-containing protein
MLLAPVAAGLGNKRLLVVSEGALQFLPFTSLLDPRSLQPLLAEHEVVNLPSASTLSVLRRELVGRKPAPRAMAVLADPVFRADDPRIAGRNGEAGGLPQEIQRSAGESGLQDLVRLRGSRREAEWISSLAPAGSSLQALDFRASRATATSGELGRYRMLHFATHALLNSQHPELSGLVLSLVDERGRPQNGYLQAHEIYNLKLNADLVVLSACQTALGQDVRSEGVIGITRGFMYAGVPRVVASLWRVSDQATGELMRRFYEGMLARKLPPAAALRQAQLALSKDPDYAHPYYWAGFTLQGEWK